jgi:hypothetical protein
VIKDGDRRISLILWSEELYKGLMQCINYYFEYWSLLTPFRELYAVSKSLQLGDYLPVMYPENFEKKSVEKTTMVYVDDGIHSKSTILL